MRFSIRHVTRFTYESPITGSVMEVRMQPRSDGTQRCLRFGLSTLPAARVMMYHDHDGNVVHHFNIPGRHSRLTVTAEALADCAPHPPLPDEVPLTAWDRLEEVATSGDCWEYLVPSTFAKPTAKLAEFARDLGLTREEDPLTLVRRLSADLHGRIEYCPESTSVDSPIDDALTARRGVCQDFAHVFIALARQAGVPCRYVSGYLFHQTDDALGSSEGATHAWAEAWIPDVGWVGLDPTNNSIAGERHIRVALGRDYADVPPTRGVYTGLTAVKSELGVAVRVGPVDPQPGVDALPLLPWMSQDAAPSAADAHATSQQQ